MSYSIGIDIGTTTVKCILFGEKAKVVAEAGKEYGTLLPSPPGRSRTRMTGGELWWNASA
mgnify:CR=1 FL=1